MEKICSSGSRVLSKPIWRHLACLEVMQMLISEFWKYCSVKIITNNSFLGQHLPFQREENSDQSLNTCSEKVPELIIHQPDPMAVCAFPFSPS